MRILYIDIQSKKREILLLVLKYCISYFVIFLCMFYAEISMFQLHSINNRKRLLINF